MIKVMEKERQSVSGFTLVEVLVVLAIFGVVLGSVLKVFSISYHSYTVQEEMAAMQQNVRVAKMFLERDVRMAGCGMKNFYDEGERVYALDFDNDSAVGDTGSDKLTINYIDYSVDSCDDLLPDLTCDGSMPTNSAVCNTVEDMSSPPYDVWTSSFVCNGTTYGKVPPFVDFPVLITSPDGSQSEIIYITQTPGGKKLQNRPIGGAGKVINTYPAGSTISFFNTSKLTEVAYYISNSVLMRESPPGTSNPVAENIEDLQFAFGLDTDANGTVDSWINNADLTDVQKDQVRSVRINVLGCTANEDTNHSSTRPTIEDHAGAGTSDGFHRKLLQVTVKVRNLGI